MKTIIIAAALAVPGVAFAGNLEPAPQPVPIDPPAVYDWSGAYVGAFFGLEDTAADLTDLDGVSGGNFLIQDIDADGVVLGAMAGHNWQRGNFVFGIEVDYTANGGSGSSDLDIVNLDETIEWKTNWSASLRARFGVAKDRTLFYGTAGVATSDVTFGYLNMDGSGTVVEGDDRITDRINGITLGAGIEHAKTDRLILRGEVLYTDYSSFREELTSAITSGTIYDPSTVTLRAAAVWKF